MTGRRKKDRVDTGVEKSAHNKASDLKRQTMEGSAIIYSSGSKFPRRRKPRRTHNRGERPHDNKPEISIFQNAKKLIVAKGYKVIQNPTAGIDMIASKPIGLESQGCVIDVLPIGFHYKSGIANIGDNYAFRQVKGESESINSLADDLIRNTRSIISSISKADRSAPEPHNCEVINNIVEGLETYSVNLLFGKLDCAGIKGKNVEFWVNSVVLTRCQLQNESGESRPWVPIPAKLKGLDVSIVGSTNLASYLDLREKEVKILGREVLKTKRTLGDFPSQLKTLRILTLSAILIPMVAFLAIVLNTATWFTAASSGLALVAAIETFGGLRLLRSYQHLKRDNNNGICLDTQKITPEQLVRNEGEFARDELPFLYSKYGGAELSNLKKELKAQRINELVRKSEDLISKAQKLESEKLYSEAVLSIEKATRSVLNAALLFAGSETQARDLDELTISLRNILQKEKLEDLRNLIELRDKINKGYNCSEREVEKAKEVSEPILETTIRRLRSSLKEECKQNKSSTYESQPSDLYTSAQKRVNRSRERKTERNKAQEKKDSETDIPNEVFNTAKLPELLIDVPGDDELLNLRSADNHPVKAKKTLETSGNDRSIPTELGNMSSRKILEELDNLTMSLTSAPHRSTMVYLGRRTSSDSSSDKVVAPNKLLRYDTLSDFRNVLTRCQLPIVASFLSGDEPSNEVKSAIESLIPRYCAKAAFIVVTSNSEEIARECKIKSYPNIIVFNKGKMIGELKLTDVEQLENEMLKMIEPTTSSDHEETYGNGIHLKSTENEVTTIKQASEQSDGTT